MAWASNQEYLAALDALVDRWCDDREVVALSRLLPGYVALNGLTDGWAVLLDALQATRALGQQAFAAGDWAILQDLTDGAERAVHGPRVW